MKKIGLLPRILIAIILGFSPDAQALIIALYIAMDSFGNACNVTGDGALAVIIDRLYQKPDSPSLQKPVHDE